MKEETKQMGLMKKLTSAIVASSLVFTLVGSASAAYTADSGATAAARMQALKIVQGMPDGTLGLDKEITRAELVTIIVRGFGQEDNAKLLQGSTAGFTDTAKHWASGNIAMAKALVEKVGGDAIGLPDGSFNPDGKLTPAQAVAFLMKFLGVKADPAKAWPANYLDKAADMGLIAADDKATIANSANTNATRGLTFYLFDRAFANYTLSTGKTFYTQYVDQTAPELTIKNDAVSTTIDSTVTVTGTVTGASELYVGTTKVTPDANGNFSSDVTLGEVKADPYTVTVTARDLAGNKTEKSIKVTRTVGTVASIEASDITVAAGGTADVAAVVKDAKGNVLANQTVTGTATSGTYADGKYTAGKTVGTDTLVLKVGDVTKNVAVTITAGVLDHVDLSAASVAPGTKVLLTAKDAAGNTISGVTYTQTSADALLDSSNGAFIASKAGQYTVTAKAGDVTKTVTIGVFDTTVASYSVTWGATSLVANNASTTSLTIKAMDKFGNLVANTTNAGTVDITVSAGAFNYSTDSTVTPATNLNGASQLKLTNGVATLTVATNNAFGGTTGKVRVANHADATIYTSATISLVDQVATSISVATDDQFLATNATTNATGFRVKVLDQDGKIMRSGYYPVTLTLNSGVNASIIETGTFDTVLGTYTTAAVAADDSVTVYYDGNAFVNGNDIPAIKVSPNFAGASGVVTVSATATGLTAGAKDVTMQFAGQPAKLSVTASSTNETAPKAGVDTMTYNVQVTDAAGVPVGYTAPALPPANVVVAFTGITNDNRAEITVTNNLVASNPTADKFEVPLVIAADGSAQFTVDAANFTGNLGFIVKDKAASGALVASPAGTVAFGADVVAKVAYTVNTLSKTSVVVPAGADAITVVAQMLDANDNDTTVAGGTLTLTSTAVAATGAMDNDVVINGTAHAGTATIAADGTATFTVKAGSFVGAQYTLALTGTYTAADGSTKTFGAVGAAALPATNLTLSVQNQVASAVSVALYKEVARTTPANTVDASAAANVFATATVTDPSGRKVADETLKVYVINSDGTTTVVAKSNPTVADLAAGITAVTNVGDGTYTFAVVADSAPGMNFKVVTQNSVNAATAQFTVGVRPDYSVGAARNVAFTADSLDLPRLTEKAVTINFTDTFGNAVVNNTGYDQNLTLTFGGQNVQIRTTAGGLSSNTVKIANGQQSVTVYLVTDVTAGSTITATVASAGGLHDIVAGTDTLTINVK